MSNCSGLFVYSRMWAFPPYKSVLYLISFYWSFIIVWGVLSNKIVDATIAARLPVCAARIRVDARRVRSPAAATWLRGARSAERVSRHWLARRLRTGQTTSVLKVVGGAQPHAYRTPSSEKKKHLPTFFGAQNTRMSATEELSGILSRRQEINEKLEEGLEVKPKYKFVNVYTEFHEFSRKEIKQYEETFNK